VTDGPDLLDAAVLTRFCCQSSLDIIVDRLDCDASRFPLGIAFQLACFDQFIQLFARDLDRTHRLIRRRYERGFKRDGARHLTILSSPDVCEDARLDIGRKALNGQRALLGRHVVENRTRFVLRS
jgi:hypothetical protein